MFAVVNCLALLLVLVFGGCAASASASVPASASADAPGFYVTGRAVAAQRRAARRKAGRRVKQHVEESRVREGAWGGEHVRLRVSAGGGTLEFDCAHGEVSAPFVLDREGRFDLSGTLTREGPGPIRIGRLPSAAPARYSGRVEGETMTLSVKVEGADRDADTYTLTRGSDGHVFKCR
jgi:hypothetical protein